MIDKIKYLFFRIFGRVPNKYKRAFADKLRMDNLARLRALSFFVVLLSPFMIFSHYKIEEQGFCNKSLDYCQFLFKSHYAGIAYAFLNLFLYKYLVKLNERRILLDILLFLLIFTFFLIYSLSSLASQFYTGNISFFTIGSMLMSALFVSYKRVTTILYIIILLIFIYGLYRFQKNPDLLLVNVLNSCLSMFFAYCVNVILFHYKVDDFLKSKKIEIKTVELNQTLKAIKKDIQVAKKIQSSLIQQSYHTDLPLNVELAYIPLEDVGGDIYDICEFGRHGVRIFLADATGHGVQAALITMAIKAEYESLKKELKSPKKLLKSLNQNFIEKFSSIASFFSCVLVDIYPEKNKIVYSSAGHPDQIIQLKSWEIVHLQRLGKLIGISKDSEYDEKEVNFEIGDKLFLFTDGLFEEFNHKKEEFGEKQIINILRAYSDKELKELFPILMKNMDQFLQHSTRQDDISFIAVEHLQESV